MKRVGYLWMLIAFCLFANRPSLAWWTVLYPQTVSEATIENKDALEETSKEIEIKWKLAEWITKWF